MRNVIIIGSLGRAFHNFNVYFKNNLHYKVVAFVSEKADTIDGRSYPVQLSGRQYSYGIPILSDEDLPFVIKKYDVDECVFSASDLSQNKLLKLSAVVQAAGADFRLLGSNTTMLQHLKPVIAICGSAKSQVVQNVIQQLSDNNSKTVVVKHPIPQGNIKERIVQRLSSLNDIEASAYSLIEKGAIQPIIDAGTPVYTGLDFHDVLNKIDKESSDCDVIVWENLEEDIPFIKPDLLITIVDSCKCINDHSTEIKLRLSDVVILDKLTIAEPSKVRQIRKVILKLNPSATIIDAVSPVDVEDSDVIRGKKVLLVETDAGLNCESAAFIAAEKYGAAEVVEVGDSNIFQLKKIDKDNLSKLELFINNNNCDLVIISCPIDLSWQMSVNKPIVRVHFQFQELGSPNIKSVLNTFIDKHL